MTSKPLYAYASVTIWQRVFCASEIVLNWIKLCHPTLHLLQCSYCQGFAVVRLATLGPCVCAHAEVSDGRDRELVMCLVVLNQFESVGNSGRHGDLSTVIHNLVINRSDERIV